MVLLCHEASYFLFFYKVRVWFYVIFMPFHILSNIEPLDDSGAPIEACKGTWEGGSFFLLRFLLGGWCGGSLPQNSQDLWEATLYRRTISVQRSARSFGTDRQAYRDPITFYKHIYWLKEGSLLHMFILSLS